jgi:WhiB family redox-sensing transcriptional regulator
MSAGFTEQIINIREADLSDAQLRAIFGASGEEWWQELSLCAQTDPEIFFPEKGGSTNLAKMICSQCVVRAECLDYALTRGERFGVWGGLSERERRLMGRQAS